MNYDRRIANALEQLVDLQIVSLKSSVSNNLQHLVNDINDRVIASRKTGKYVPYDDDGPEQTGCSHVMPIFRTAPDPANPLDPNSPPRNPAITEEQFQAALTRAKERTSEQPSTAGLIAEELEAQTGI